MTGKMIKTCAICVTVVTSLIATSSVEAAAEYRTVALSGDAAPGAGLGAVYDNFGGSVINKDGKVAFNASLTGPGVDRSNVSGIWSESENELNLVVRRGDPAPGAGQDAVFAQFENLLNIDDYGNIGIKGKITGSNVTAITATGIWAEKNGSLELIARAGDMAPGTGAGALYCCFSTSFKSTPRNSNGQIAFQGDLSNGSGIWAEESDALRLVARSGIIAPGAANIFKDFGDPVINDTGHTAFLGYLYSTDTNNSGIWSEGYGGLHLVAREGDPAPQTEPGVVFGEFSSSVSDDRDPVINNAGQTAFLGVLNGTGIDTTNNSGIWLEDKGSVKLIARAGDPAPDVGPGIVFGSSFITGSSFLSPLLNGSGHVAFTGIITGEGVDGSNNQGLWLGDEDELRLMVRKGDPAPGTEPGTVLIGFRSPPLSINRNGQMTFQGFLAGPGVVEGNDRALFVTDPNGKLVLIAREGDHFDVNDDPNVSDLRTITAFGQIRDSGGEDGRRSTINDAGQLVFWLKFSDDSEGLFSILVPEPGSILMLMTGTGLLIKRYH